MTGTLKWITVLSALIFLTGSDFISINDIPTPFADDIVYGKGIKEIRLEGNNDTRADLMHMAMASKVGEAYTRETAELDVKWLAQLGCFTSLYFHTIEEADSVILVVQVTEVNRITPAPILKVTDENGVSVGGLISSLNLGGYAIRASAYFLVGGTTNFGFRFKDPWVPGRSWMAGYQFDYVHSERRNELYDFDERADDIFFSLNRNLTNTLRWGPQVFYLKVKSDQPDITLSSDNRDHIPGLGVFLRYDRRNRPIYPTKGWWTGLNLKKYGLGGEGTDYWQLNMDLRRYLELAGYRHALALYTLASFSSGEVGTDIPIYMQFNLGGANSVRGWDLGSREGKNQLVFTAEYWYLLMRHKRLKAWFFKWAMGLQIGVFGDLGTAWSRDEQFHRNWIGGGGVGLRLLLPSSVMFRLDVGVGGGAEVSVNFFISGREKAVAQLDRVR